MYKLNVVFEVLDYLFYQNIYVMLLSFPANIFLFRWQKQNLIRSRVKAINLQFRDALNSLNVAVQAGYSIENALIASARDLEQLYPSGADILSEFRDMEHQLYLSVPIEDLFLDLGARTGVEDIENFAAVFSTAKRTGGDMGEIIQKTAHMLSDKIDVAREIEASLTAKKHEQTLMSLMPAAIILYLRLTSPGLLDVMYGNLFGASAMTACLAVYAFSFWLGRRIIDIEV